MRTKLNDWFFEKIKISTKMLFVFIVALHLDANSQSAPLRRPVSPAQPMWLIHIDTWNYADPQKIIDLVPKDIRPYVVMNISLSISHNSTTSQFQVAEYGYEIAKSWLRTCAQNQMWAMIQPSSGGYSQFSDFDLSVYEEFYRDYPNCIGFNYCEQFWGYNDVDPLSAKWEDRIAHFADLLKLSNKYGGYLVVSWCANEWSPSINPIGMLKRNPNFAAACRDYTENFILCEKYTQQSYQSDMESLCLGAYLSGYSGNYGIRYDDTGWTDANGNHSNFTMATAGAVHLEHIMLTGETVIDAPELIWTQCFRETDRVATTDGYMMRNWATFPQFDNVSIDIFRKILDGTVRIPSRREVIDRTKVVIINDINSGTNDEIYSSPQTLFEGLYRMDGDGNYQNNKTFFKKTGRYPTIPTVFQLNDTDAQSFQVKINKSAYSGRWPNITAKTTELNNLFAQEYTGNLYAGRHENGWVTYNPYKTGQSASAIIPFKYNTCERMELTYSQYTAGVIKEYPDKLTIYLSNYDNVINTGLKNDTIKIYGSSSEPAYSYTDRGNHQASTVTKNWSGGVFTLIVRHNGSIDIAVNCAGTATDRLTSFTNATLIEPDKPAIYTGPRQYEAECFDYKSVSGVTTAGQNGSIRNYTGQGYLTFGTNSSASVRDTVYALRSGNYQLKIRYSVTGGDVSTIDLYVNGTKVATPAFSKTSSLSNWNSISQMIELNAGKNVIVFKANSTGAYNLVFDNIVITQGTSNGVYHFENDTVTTVSSEPAAELITVKSGSAGVISYTDNNSVTSNCFMTYSCGVTNGTGIASLDMFSNSAIDYSVVWKEYYTTAGGKKGVLLRGSGDDGSCPFAEGMKQGYLFIVLNNNDSTVTLETYIADTNGLTDKPTYTSSFRVGPDEPCWFRARALGHELKMECSVDSINWEGATETTFTDSAYTLGSTELVWGLNADNYSWMMDNISSLTGNLFVSLWSIDKLNAEIGKGASPGQTFTVSGKSLINNIEIIAPKNFEVSTNSDSGYDSTLMLISEGGEISSATVFVRLKSGLDIGTYTGELKVSSDGVYGSIISLKGEVKPQKVTKIYTFSNDVVSTSAQTPPAMYTSIGQNNSATAGAVSYSNVYGFTGNMIKPYSGGQRNSTGVINLDMFSKKSTDYSVTWTQYVSGTSESKVGILVRGDTANIGDDATGYVQGMMNGYLLLVYTVGTTRSEFRIYKSTSSYNVLDIRANNTISTLKPTSGQPIWYRASVSGSSTVSLMIEYSTDGITWQTGASITDVSANVFTSGATQLIWGLGVSNVNFYLDNIMFSGIESATETGTDFIDLSRISLNEFSYKEGFGASAHQTFTVSGTQLTDDIEITAPSDFEISFDTSQVYTSTLTLTQTDNTVEETTVYVRMKSGLAINSYEGDLSIKSNGAMDKIVLLTGKVISAVSGIHITNSAATVISTEYYTLTGQRVSNIDNLKGLFIVREILSDGTVHTSKKYVK